VNAAFLIMSTAALAGADPAPVAPAPAAPIVISGAGCSNCGTPVYTSGCGGCKPSLFDKIKSKFGSRSHGCGCAPAPVAATCNTCNPCTSTASYRPNLLDKVKGHWASKKCGPSCTSTCDPCATGVSGCATPLPPGAPAVPPGGTVPPKEMPKEMPKDTKPKTTGNASALPQPVTGAGLTGTSPY
jgi:hypothetical protein